MVDASGPVGRQTGSNRVMSAVEESGRGETLVVADITRDDAWVSVETGDAVSTDEWR